MPVPCRFTVERDALIRKGYAEDALADVILGWLNATLEDGAQAFSSHGLMHRARGLKVYRSTAFRSEAARRGRAKSTAMPRQDPLNSDCHRQKPLPPRQSLHAIRGGDISTTLQIMAGDVAALGTCPAERDCALDWGRRNGICEPDLAAINALRQKWKLPTFRVR